MTVFLVVGLALAIAVATAAVVFYHLRQRMPNDPVSWWEEFDVFRQQGWTLVLNTDPLGKTVFNRVARVATMYAPATYPPPEDYWLHEVLHAAQVAGDDDGSEANESVTRDLSRLIREGPGR